MTAKKKRALFSRIESREDALAVIREASTGFFVIAAIQAALSFIIGFSVFLDAAAYALLGFILRRYHSRVAAVLLLLLGVGSLVATVANKLGTNDGGGTNIILAAIVFWAAIRSVEATFKLRSRFPPSAESTTLDHALGPNAGV